MFNNNPLRSLQSRPKFKYSVGNNDTAFKQKRGKLPVLVV